MLHNRGDRFCITSPCTKGIIRKNMVNYKVHLLKNLRKYQLNDIFNCDEIDLFQRMEPTCGFSTALLLEDKTKTEQQLYLHAMQLEQIITTADFLSQRIFSAWYHESAVMRFDCNQSTS